MVTGRAHGDQALRIDPQGGTDESRWDGWDAPAGWPALDVGELAEAGTVVVVAAHPDDEVLGVGGLVARLVTAGARIRFVWATDGEASHPASSAHGVRDLAATRRAESTAALRRLGAGEASRLRLGLPDGGLAEAEADLVRRLRNVVAPDETVLAPWSGDAHPDHEACGRAARAVAGRVLEYPVWTWHWAEPDDDRVPWDRCRRVDLDADVVERKNAAIDCFSSQINPLGPEPADGPVLPPGVLAHFRRPYELVLA